MSRLNRIRKTNPALQSTWNIDFADASDPHIISYIKSDGDTHNTLIIAVNLDPFATHAAMLRLPLEGTGIPTDRPYRVHDLLSGDTYQWQGDYNFVELRPHEMPAHIFKVDY